MDNIKINGKIEINKFCNKFVLISFEEDSKKMMKIKAKK